METNPLPLSRLLIPVDASTPLQRLVPVISAMIANRTNSLEKIHLLHVNPGSFLSAHLSNIDYRASQLLTSEQMNRLRAEHHRAVVEPMMRKTADSIRTLGFEAQVEEQILEGNPVREIIRYAKATGVTTMILSRRDRQEEDLFSMGSVTTGLLQRHLDATIYLVGRHVRTGEGGQGPGSLGGEDGGHRGRYLAAIDDSEESGRALVELLAYAGKRGDLLEQVVLLHVIDEACAFDWHGEEACKRDLMDADAIQSKGLATLTAGGIPEDKILCRAVFGKPAVTILEEAEMQACSLIFLGRRNRSKLAEVFMGSVCSSVLQRGDRFTLVLVN